MSNDHPVIAILGGTGKEGTGLATRWAAAGYTVLIGSRQAEKAEMAAQQINSLIGKENAVGLTNPKAASQAEISILTVIYSAHQEALESIKHVMGSKILVDATSRVDYHDPKPPSPPCAAEEAQSLLGPEVKVVAAFQNIPARMLKQRINEPMDADAMVCSDDISAAEQVIRLAKYAGMQAYYTGPLANANVVEGLTSLLISLNQHYGVKDASIRVTGISDEG